MRNMGRAVRGLFTLAAAGAVLGCGDAARLPTALAIPESPLFAATTTTTNDRIPFTQVAFVPCAAGGAGELVLISGTLHVLFHTTISDNGSIHLKSHFQPQGATAVGLTTGDTYRAVGVTQTHTNFNAGADNQTLINNFRMIGPGPDNNFQVHQNVHVTVNANGEVTAVVNNTSIECN